MSRLLALALVLPLCVAAPAQTTTVPAITDDDSYAVYAALLKLDDEAKARTTLYLSQMTGSLDCPALGKDLPPAWKAVLADYLVKNARQSRLVEGMDLPVPYVLLTPDDVDTLRLAWMNEPRPAPSVIFQVSAVGFDPGKQRAIVYLGHSCGVTCADGRHRFLDKRDGEWVEARVGTICMWMAD